MAFAENDLLKKACEAAEKAHEDLKEISTVTEVFPWFSFCCFTHLLPTVEITLENWY